MQPTKRCIVCSVSKISACVEWFFDAKTIILQEMPTLLLLRDELPFSHRDDVFLVIEFVAVVSEEMEEQFSQSLLVVIAKAL